MGGRPKDRELATRPFEGTTTYMKDFPGHTGRPSTPKKPTQSVGQSVPFDGSSEYRREYLKRQLAGRAFLHLEPAVRPLTPGLSVSAPSGPRPARPRRPAS